LIFSSLFGAATAAAAIDRFDLLEDNSHARPQLIFEDWKEAVRFLQLVGMYAVQLIPLLHKKLNTNFF